MGNNTDAREQSHAEALAHPALVRSISRRLAMAEFDVVRVIDLVLSRLEMGRDQYGDLNLATDHRDFIAETLAEHFDAVIYLACHTVREQDRERGELREAARKEMERATSFHLGTAPGDAPNDFGVATQATDAAKGKR